MSSLSRTENSDTTKEALTGFFPFPPCLKLSLCYSMSPCRVQDSGKKEPVSLRFCQLQTAETDSI